MVVLQARSHFTPMKVCNFTCTTLCFNPMKAYASFLVVAGAHTSYILLLLLECTSYLLEVRDHLFHDYHLSPW
jgi:hypothetical protein